MKTIREPRAREQGKRAAAEAGFNLLEMMISMTVLGVIVGGAFGMLFRSQVTFELQQANADLRQQARVSLDVLTTELRLAGYEIDNLTEPVTRGGANVLQFVGDLDDGDAGTPCGAAFETATDGGAERVTYELATGRLLRTVECWDGSSWTPEYQDQAVAQNLLGDQSLFRFWDEDGAEIAPAGAELTASQRDEVRVVTIDMEMLDPTDYADGPSPAFELSARVRLPNVD